MKRVGEVIIENDKITTPNGQYPLNSGSAVWMRKIRRKQYAKKAIGLSCCAAATSMIAAGAATIATGGAGIFLFALAGGFTLMHDSYEVVISTDRVEFVVHQFDEIRGANKVRANKLKDAIAEVISEARG